MDLPDLPEGWNLKALTEEDGLWKVFAYSAEEYVCGGGSSPRYAMLDTIARIEDGTVHVRLMGGKTRAQAIDVLAVLGLDKPAPKKNFVRRI